jgi:hypothetical protein
MKGNISGKLVLTACILIGLFVVSVCAEEPCVTRNITDLTYGGNSIDVTINLNGLRAGGIIETIPSGMTFVSTTHPEERYKQEEQNIIFSVLNDDSIRYTLRAGITGPTTITGIWYDALTKQDGRIADASQTGYAYPSGGSDDANVSKEKTDVSVHAPPFTAPDEADKNTHINPLFFVAALIVIIIGIAAIVVMKKKEKRRRSDYK